MQIGFVATSFWQRLHDEREDELEASPKGRAPGLAYLPRIRKSLTAQERVMLSTFSITDRNKDGFDDDAHIAFAFLDGRQGDRTWGGCLDLRTGAVGRGDCRQEPPRLPRANFDRSAAILAGRMIFFDRDQRFGKGVFGIDIRDLETVRTVSATDLPIGLELYAYDEDGDGLVDGKSQSGPDGAPMDIKAFVWLRRPDTNKCAEVGLPVYQGGAGHTYTWVVNPQFDCDLIPQDPSEPQTR